jgi:hypothetical protein
MSSSYTGTVKRLIALLRQFVLIPNRINGFMDAMNIISSPA